MAYPTIGGGIQGVATNLDANSIGWVCTMGYMSGSNYLHLAEKPVLDELHRAH